MEEVWLERFSGDTSSVHLEDFAEAPADWRDQDLAARWAQIRMVRRVVTGALEIERREKRIGASLEAAPVVYVSDPDLRTLLEGRDMDDLCITSGLIVSAEPAPENAFTLDDVEGVAVVANLANGAKCTRCWKILPDVGLHTHAAVCGRCDQALV
jgi:isoleucyl-tRNA synthetase